MPLRRKAPCRNHCVGPKAFTLIELLVVISIIAILAALLMPVFSKVRAKGRIVETRGNLAALEIALRSYKDDNTEFCVETPSPAAPVESFYYQLTNYGMNYPYIKKTMPTVVGPAGPKSLLVKDAWYVGSKVNHIRYFRGPQRNATGIATEALYKAALADFFGNDATFNLWSFGPNRVDDSSDGCVAPYMNSGGDEGGDPSVSAGIGDDLTNWNTNTLSK